jgi:hypothetical protein
MSARSPSPSSTDQLVDPAVGRRLEHLADGDPAAGGELVARQPDEGEQLALEDRADEDEGRPRPVGERHGCDTSSRIASRSRLTSRSRAKR